MAKVSLDKITDEHVSTLRTKLVRLGRAPKTLNNVLSPLNACLKLAVKWRVIPSLPCTIEIRPVSDMRPDFYDEPDYERLCDGARNVGTREHVLVRLGGDAGLRRGEMMALRWCDVDSARALLRIEQAAWKRSAKDVQRSGGAEWHIGICAASTCSARTTEASRRGHLMRDWLETAQRRAGVPVTGRLHVLRHTFCSHLAMRGAPANAIQELAGHADLGRTMRYMHLSPAAREGAIALLNRRSHGTLVARQAAEGENLAFSR